MTRERILKAASTLFATKGYSGTRSREIADAVGIRQPSLFHHFASKSAIAEALLDHSLGRVTEPVCALAMSDESAASRLYGYVYFDTLFLATSPYDLGGLHSDDVLSEPAFAFWRERLVELHEAIAEIIRQGIEREEFVVLDPLFAQRVISGLNLITISMHHGESPAWATQFADDVATFALRGLLSALSELPRARREGVEIAERLRLLTTPDSAHPSSDMRDRSTATSPAATPSPR
jgi:AcrR family transcriptional regulator